MRSVITSLLVCAVAGCASKAARIDDEARAAGLMRYETSSGGFRSFIYMKSRASTAQLIVFLEGDGQPWRGGLVPNDDPTTRRPIALELLKRTDGGGAYITRPCYHRMRDARCTPDHWTGARYSAEVVDSMAAAAREAMDLASAKQVVLVGYSGGGVLAVLIAERLEHVSTVVTLAANLDTDAWTKHHGYLPLSESLNPALGAREHPWRESHFQGARDARVPPATTEAYFERYPSAHRKTMEDYDHVCCWVDAWPSLWKEIEAQEGRPQGAPRRMENLK